MPTTPEATTPESAAPKHSTWGVALGKVLHASEVMSAAITAEQLGFDDVWVSNERFHRDMFTMLGVLAVKTDRVGLGTFVTDPYTMHPLVSAAAVATVDQLSGGRAMFAIGAGGSGFSEMGIAGTRPLGDIESAVRSARRLFRGETVSAEGSSFAIENAKLEVLPVAKLPLIIASQSPKMLALGGAVADGVMISTFAHPSLMSMAIGWARDGAVEAGRQFHVGRDVIARIDVAIDRDRGAARDRIRPLIGYLLVLLHPRWWFLDVIGVGLPADLVEIAERRDFAAMRVHLNLIPDELIDAFGWCGTSDDVAAGVARLEELGVRRFVVLPHAETGGFVDTIRAVAGQVTRLEARGT